MRLKELRKANGYNQRELAEKLGYKQSTVSNWENGNRLLDADTALHIADFFGVTTDYLLGRKPEPTTGINPLQNRLIQSFNKLNDVGKHEAINRVEELTQLNKYRKIDRAMPIAAHNEAEITDEEIKLMQKDIDEL